jgi:hypothetical protein
MPRYLERESLFQIRLLQVSIFLQSDGTGILLTPLQIHEVEQGSKKLIDKHGDMNWSFTRRSGEIARSVINLWERSWRFV